MKRGRVRDGMVDAGGMIGIVLTMGRGVGGGSL